MDILSIALVEILIRIRIMSIVLVSHESDTEMCLLRLLLRLALRDCWRRGRGEDRLTVLRQLLLEVINVGGRSIICLDIPQGILRVHRAS